MTAEQALPDDIDLLDIRLFQERREHAAFERLRALATPPLHPEPDGPGFFPLTRFDQVWEAARDNETFLSGMGTQIADKRAEGSGAPSVHNADPPLHTRLRGFGRRALARDLLEARRDRVRAIIRELIDRTPRGRPFDFVEAVALPVPMIVFGEVLGVPEADRERLVALANTMSSVTASEEEQADSRSALFAYFRDLAARKRAHPGDDVASMLVAPDEEGHRLSDEELDAYFLLLVVAGNETTRFLLAGGLEQLLLDGDALARLRADPALIPGAVEEMLRWVTPVIHMRRTVARDTTCFGVEAPAGSKFVLYFSAANRDPAVFEAPGRFLLDRSPNRHVGFGAGHHFCLGAYLARLEARLFLEEFLRAIRHCELVAPGRRLPSHWFAGLESLEVRWR